MPSRLLYIFIVAFSCFIFTAQCVAQKTVKPEKYATWVYHGRIPSDPGLLRYVSTDTVILSGSFFIRDNTEKAFPVAGISQIRIRKRTNQGLGALIGLIGGGVLGYALGRNYEGDDYCGGKCPGTNKGTITALSTISAAVVGIGVGTIIGSRKKKFKLNGSLSQKKMDRLQPYIFN